MHVFKTEVERIMLFSLQLIFFQKRILLWSIIYTLTYNLDTSRVCTLATWTAVDACLHLYLMEGKYVDQDPKLKRFPYTGPAFSPAWCGGIVDCVRGRDKDSFGDNYPRVYDACRARSRREKLPTAFRSVAEITRRTVPGACPTNIYPSSRGAGNSSFTFRSAARDNGHCSCYFHDCAHI